MPLSTAWHCFLSTQGESGITTVGLERRVCVPGLRPSSFNRMVNPKGAAELGQKSNGAVVFMIVALMMTFGVVGAEATRGKSLFVGVFTSGAVMAGHALKKS